MVYRSVSRDCFSCQSPRDTSHPSERKNLIFSQANCSNTESRYLMNARLSVRGDLIIISNIISIRLYRPSDFAPLVLSRGRSANAMVYPIGKWDGQQPQGKCLGTSRRCRNSHGISSYFELGEGRKDLSSLSLELTARNMITGEIVTITVPLPTPTFMLVEEASSQEGQRRIQRILIRRIHMEREDILGTTLGGTFRTVM